MAIFNSNKDLDSTIVVTRHRIYLMAGAMYFHVYQEPAVKRADLRVQS